LIPKITTFKITFQTITKQIVHQYLGQRFWNSFGKMYREKKWDKFQDSRNEKLTASNNEWFWCPFSSTDDLGEEPSSDSSGTGDGGLAGM
jgi:hypothetical protein